MWRYLVTSGLFGNLGHNTRGWDVASGSETSCQESNFLRPPVPPKFEPKRPRFLVAALCVGLLPSLRPPFASAGDDTASTPHMSSANAPKVCSQWLIDVEGGQVIGNGLEFVLLLYLKFLLQVKTKQWRRIHTPPQLRWLKQSKINKEFLFFKCFDSADFMNFCLQKCWRSALVAQEPWANCDNQAASHIHATLMHCRIPPRPHLVKARYEEHHHGNRVSTYLKYLILTLKTKAEPRPDGPRNSTILASTSVRILSFLAMKLPLHPENNLNTVSPFSAVETCSSQLCFPHLKDVHRRFHTAAGLLLRFPHVEPSKATFTLQAPKLWQNRR